MVGAASHPAWAALVVEACPLAQRGGLAARLHGAASRARGAGRGLSGVLAAAELCRGSAQMPELPGSEPGAGHRSALVAVATAVSLGLCWASWRYDRTRTAPARRGGGVVV